MLAVPTHNDTVTNQIAVRATIDIVAAVLK